MFDLHMHTTYSDGKLSVDEMLTMLVEKEVKFFSITDHNNCFAYEHFDIADYPMISGVELATSFQGNIIELLGYGVDTKAINAWYRLFFSKEELQKKEMFLFHRLKKIAIKHGLIVSEDLKIPNFEKDISKKTVYQDLIKHNPLFFQQYPTYRSFFRIALSNPNHDYFLNEAITYPKLNDAIDLLRQAGGLVFLAHPYEYSPEILNELLVWSANHLDGIECFHPSASLIQSSQLFKFCIRKDIMACGGSDFHSVNRLIPLGVRISSSFYDQKPFAWLHEYIKKENFE